MFDPIEYALSIVAFLCVLLMAFLCVAGVTFLVLKVLLS